MTTNTATISTRQRAAWATVRGLARAAAWAISLRHQITQHSLTDEECDALGMPQGSTLPAVHVMPLQGARWWTMDAWTDDGDGQPDGRCLHLRLLGHSVEVFYRVRGAALAAAA